jgi:hypothetical protein
MPSRTHAPFCAFSSPVTPTARRRISDPPTPAPATGVLAAQLLRSPPLVAPVLGMEVELFGAAWAQDDLRKISRPSAPESLTASLRCHQARQQFDDLGSLFGADLREQLVEHIDELLAAA